MEIAIAVVAGLLMGHIVDLVFPRFYTDAEMGGPLYRCAECKGPFRLVFALPVMGFALSGSRCPDCGVRLPVRSLVLPVGSAALFVVSALVFEDLGPALLGGFFATVFLTLTLTDFERRLLPNRIVYPSTLIAVAVSWAWPDSSFVEVLGGGLVAFAIAATLLIASLPFGGGAFGIGDVKMIILIGFVVGLPAVLVGIVIGTIAAAVASAVLILTGLRTRKDYIPHGPFLALGALIALFWGEEIWDAYRGN